jgi:hypothetical protein
MGAADVVDAVCRREFPTRRVAERRPAERGGTKDTTFVTFHDGTTVVVQVAADAAALETETALATAVRERTPIPVPAVRATGTVDDHAYAVVDQAPGVDGHERFAALAPEDRRRLARTFGRWLATLHETFAFDAYGPVTYDATHDAFAATGDREWRPWFRAYVREGVDALPGAFAPLEDRLRDALAHAEVPAAPPARLYPWDLRPGNALLDDGAVTAVLDWGHPLAAATGLAYAKTEHLVAYWYVADPDPLRSAFHAGYEAVRDPPTVLPVYRLAAVVRSAVDSHGAVTRPRFPELHGERAVQVHREWLRDALAAVED